MTQRGHTAEIQTETEHPVYHLSNIGVEDSRREFPFLSTPSGNLKIEPKQVVFESRKVSVLVADPMNTKVNVKADLGNPELMEQRTHHIFKGMNPNEENRLHEDYRRHGDVETDFSLEMMTTKSADTIDWTKVNIPAKTDLIKHLMYRISNSIKPDCQVLIAGDQFNCHSLVLQSYSSYFDSREPGGQFELTQDRVSSKAFTAIYQWMIYPDPDSYHLLTKNNILEVFMAAQFLGIKELEEQCWAFIDCDELFSEASAFCMYLKAKHLGNQAITELMVPRIMKFFLTLVSSTNFLGLTVEELCAILQSNYIAVHCELEVFMSAVRWLMYDWENRKEHLIEVMQCIRFGLIPPWHLVDIRRNPKNPEFIEITSHPDVQQMVEDGLEYAIVKYWYGNKKEEYQHWCSTLSLEAPSPRNWLPEEKNYETYLQFLDDLESYRRSILEGHPISYNQSPVVYTSQTSPPMPPTLAEIITHKKEIQLASGDVGAAHQVTASSDETMSTSHNQQPVESAEVSSAQSVNMDGLRLTSIDGTHQRQLSISMLGPVSRNYLEDGSLFFPEREAVLVFGGTDPHSKYGEGSNLGKAVFRFHPEANFWESVGELPEPRHHHAVAFLKGHVYVVGGADPRKSLSRGRSTVMSTVWSFEPVKRAWISEPGMLTARQNLGLVVSNGKLYAIGGQDRSGKVLRSVERFDPVSGVWEMVAPMHDSRMGLAAAKYRGHIWVAGGLTGDRCSRVTDSVEYYDVRKDMWVTCKQLRLPLCFGRLFTMQDTLYLIGGAARTERDHIVQSVDTIDIWDPVRERWCMHTEMAIPRHGHSVAYVGTQILIIGGVTTAYMRALNNVECFCCERGNWIRGAAELPATISGHGSVTLPPASLM